MSKVNTDSNSSALLSDSDLGDNKLQFEIERDRQLTEIFEPEGRLIAYLSVLCFFGIIVCILYFFFL